MVKRSSLELLRVHFSNHQKPSCLWITLKRHTQFPLKEMPGSLTGIENDGIEFITQLKKNQYLP
jgi:hypothetical protein